MLVDGIATPTHTGYWVLSSPNAERFCVMGGMYVVEALLPANN